MEPLSIISYIFTHRWTLYILICLILLCISESTRKVVGYSLISAVGFWLLWVFVWLFRQYPTCKAVTDFAANYWFEISFASGVIWTFFPSISTWIRFVVAAPVGWIAVAIFDLIYNFFENLILMPLAQWIYAPAGNIWQIIGNLITVFIMVFVCNFIVGKYHRAVTIVSGAFIIALELVFMFSSQHECMITPINFWPNESLTWWQWVGFALSVVEIALLVGFNGFKEVEGVNEDA